MKLTGLPNGLMVQLAVMMISGIVSSLPVMDMFWWLTSQLLVTGVKIPGDLSLVTIDVVNTWSDWLRRLWVDRGWWQNMQHYLWGIGEGGAAGPTGNPYGDPPGHAWVAVAGAAEATRHVLTGDDDRVANMAAFAGAALALLCEQLEG